MSAGIKWEGAPKTNPREFCQYATVYRLTGGFVLDLTNLAPGSYIEPFTPLSINFTTRRAVAVKNVKVKTAYTSGTSLEICKNSLAYVGMHIGNGTKGAIILAIDKSNVDFDTLTLSTAFGESVAVGVVLFEATSVDGITPKNRTNFFNYAVTKVETGASVTAIGQAFEIFESKLIVPVSEKDKESLGHRFMFV